MIKPLKCFVCGKRESFHVYEKKGKEISRTNDYVRLCPLDNGRLKEAAFPMSETFRVQTFLLVIIQFLRSLEQRLKAYGNTFFDFLCDLQSRKQDIVTIEYVQRRTTKMLPGMNELTYAEKQKKLDISTLAYKRIRGGI